MKLQKFYFKENQKVLKLVQLLLSKHYLKYAFVLSWDKILKHGHPNLTCFICSCFNISNISYNVRLIKPG